MASACRKPSQNTMASYQVVLFMSCHMVVMSKGAARDLFT